MTRTLRCLLVTVTAVIVGVVVCDVADAELVHRYSFTADASDSIGGADGTLMHGASISGGQVSFNGVGASGDPTPQHVALPGPTIALNTFTDVTFEAWYTNNESGNWARVFDFGATNSGTGYGQNYVLYTLNSGGTKKVQSSISDGHPGFSYEQDPDLMGPTQPPGETHVAVTVNTTGGTYDLFIDGALANSLPLGKSLSNVNNDLAYLGRSLYSGDAVMNGSINEFRIWDHGMNLAEFQASQAAGPDELPAGGGPTEPGIVAGDVIKLDLSDSGDLDGGSLADWNQLSTNGFIPSGSVIRHGDGAVVDGATIALAGRNGNNDDGNGDGWAGTASDPYYIPAANDIVYCTGNLLTATFGGLDNTLDYNVRVYTLLNEGGDIDISVTDGAGTILRTDLGKSDLYNTSPLSSDLIFNDVSTNGSDEIVVSLIRSGSHFNLAAVVLEAVPEPTTFVLAAFGLIGLCLAGRRRT